MPIQGKEKSPCCAAWAFKERVYKLKSFLICVLSGPIPLYIIYSITYRVK